MIYKKYSLSDFSNGKLKSKSDVSLTAFIPENFPEMDMERRRKAMSLLIDSYIGKEKEKE